MARSMHSDMQFLLAARDAAGPPGDTVADYRRFWNAYAAATARPAPADMSIRDQLVPVGGRSVPVRVYRPAGAAGLRPGLVYMHGGGFMLGDLDSSDTTAWGLAEGTGAVTVSIDYRLAPEHPFPAAFEDCWGVLGWLASHGEEIGIDVGRLAVAGDSAGGNMAAVLSIAARDRSGPALRAQALVYPWLGLPFTAASYTENADGPGLTLTSMKKFDAAYMARETDHADPLARPIIAESLACLPPALVHTAELDPIRDDGRVYAARLAQAGTQVVFREAKGMIHGFLRARFGGPTAAAEFAVVAEFLRKHFDQD